MRTERGFMRKKKKKKNMHHGKRGNISMQSKENEMEEEEDLKESDLEKEETYELLAYIGVPFDPDGEPIGID